MAKIHVHTPFTLTKDDGAAQSFLPGSHEVDDDIADHWYVRAHSGEQVQAAAQVSEADVAAELAEERASLDRAAKFLEGRAEQLSQVQSDLDARARELDALDKSFDAAEADLKAREEALAAREAAFAAKTAAAPAQQELVAKDAGAHQGQRKQGK